jgi:hypothetical protein
MANVNAFARLVGALSNLRFSTVTDRFLSEINKQVAAKEAKLEILIRSMRFLKLKIYPMENLEETADFLRVISDSFQESHSVKIKHAFAQVFVDLLEPLVAVSHTLNF